MIRIGSVKTQTDSVAAIIRGLKDRYLGTSLATITLGSRDDGEGNGAVLGHLIRRHPALIEGTDAVCRAAARERFAVRTSTLDTIARDAGEAWAHEVAARLRSGRYVTNLPATTARKAARGHSTTPGVDSGQLADALDSAQIRTE